MNIGGGDTGPKRTKAFVKNPNVNPEWAITPGESYKDVFHPNRDKIPKRTESSPPICATLQIKGSCHDGCRFDHEKIPRGTTIHTKFNQWCGDCRKGNF